MRARLSSLVSTWIALGAGLALASPAQATGFFVEPAIGYGLGGHSQSVTGPQAVTANGGTQEGVLDLRAGMRIGEVFYSGLQMQYDFGAESDNANGQSVSENQNRTLAGIFAGAYIPGLPLRAWVGWDFFDREDVSQANISTVNTPTPTPDLVYTGGGLRIGASYLFGPLGPFSRISANFEYQWHSYNTLGQGGVTTQYPYTPAANTTEQGPVYSLFILTLGLPFEFPLD